MARKGYTEQFKADAVNLVLEQGYSVSKAANALGVGETALRRWLGNRQPKTSQVSAKPPAHSTDQQRIRELEKQVAQLERERDILKKSTTFFVKELDRNSK